MRIGTVEIQGRAALAPMAGVADRAFRKICVDYGAGYVVGEMVSCKGLCFQDAKSRELLRLDDEERPAAVQLFGDDPDIMARAAVLAMEYRPDVIDINMGCPAPKIAGNHCGSALMREPDLCRRIVQAVARAVPVPVTAKIRKGYGPDCVNAVEVARAVEAGGAAAVTVHGRTRDQMYAPPVDWDIIRQVKEALRFFINHSGKLRHFFLVFYHSLREHFSKSGNRGKGGFQLMGDISGKFFPNFLCLELFGDIHKQDKKSG